MKTNFNIFLIILFLGVLVVGGCKKAIIDTSECDNIENQDNQDICYYDIAIPKLDYGFCGKIQDKDMKHQCYDIVYQNIESSINDLASSPYLDMSWESIYCFTFLFLVESMDELSLTLADIILLKFNLL